MNKKQRYRALFENCGRKYDSESFIAGTPVEYHKIFAKTTPRIKNEA